MQKWNIEIINEIRLGIKIRYKKELDIYYDLKLNQIKWNEIKLNELFDNLSLSNIFSSSYQSLEILVTVTVTFALIYEIFFHSNYYDFKV